MRKDKNHLPYLHDILAAINSIEVYIVDAPEENKFIEGKGLYQDAIVRNIQIIGEAAKKIDASFRGKYPEVPWKLMAGMRDKVIHDYAEVDWLEVWKM